MVPDVVESLKVITALKSRRTAQYAFEYALLNNRRTVTAVHKANIMKLGDGLFLRVRPLPACCIPAALLDVRREQIFTLLCSLCVTLRGCCTGRRMQVLIEMQSQLLF